MPRNLTPEVRAAAERCNYLLHLPPHGADASSNVIADYAILAKAYLTVLDADARGGDGEEPITEEWLRSIGAMIRPLMNHEKRWAKCRAIIGDHPNKRAIQIDIAIDDYIEVGLLDRHGSYASSLIYGHATRRQLRDLLAALGKEVG